MKTIRDFWLRWYAFLPIILVVLVFLVYDLMRSYIREIDFAHRNNENIARVLDGHLSSSIDKIDIALSAAIADIGENLTPDRFDENNQKLAKILEKLPESQSLRIANTEGDFIFDASSLIHKTNIGDRDYFITSKNNPYAGLIISKPIRARITNNWVITISRQFRDKQGNFLGIVQAAIKSEYFIKFYDSLNLGQDGLVALLSDDLILFARQPNIPEVLGSKINDNELKLFMQDYNGAHYTVVSPVDNIERIAYAKKASSGHPFIFVVATSNSQVFSELYWKAVIYFLLMILLIIAYYYIISSWRRRHDYALKLAEQMTSVMQEQTNRLSSIIDATQVGTWEWNVQTGEIFFNEKWAEMIGFELKELDPISVDTWLSHTHPDDLELSAELLERHFAGELPYYECEVRMWHKNSYWVWILDRGQVTSWTDSGQPLWMFGTHQDISATKALEFSLKNLLEDHERLVQNIPVGVFRYYVNHKEDNGIKLSYASPRWCEQLEITEEDAKFDINTAFNKIHTEDIEYFKKIFKNACDQHLPISWEGRIQLKQGIKWIRIEATVTALPNLDLLWNGIQSDITLEIESRQAEQRANALQKALLNNSAVGIFLTTWDRKIEQISHRACELFGYSEEDLLGKTAQIIHIDEEHYQNFADNYIHLNEKRLIDLEFPFRHSDGHIFWCAVSGTPLDLSDRNKGVIWTFLDIDERRHLAEEVDRQRRTLNDILNSIPAAVSYWDAQDEHNIHNVFSNRTYAEWYATTPEALVGIHVRDLIGNELYQANWHRMAAARLGETLVYDRLQPYIPSQPQRYAQVYYIPDLCDGKPKGIYVMMFDTTNIKKSELEMKRAKELAEEAVQAKGRFLANMSHEIRTPMNAVLGFLELLNRTTLDQQQTDYAQKAQIAAQTLLDLINDILDFSKVEAGKLELEYSEFSLSGLLDKLSIILSSSVKNKPIEIQFDIDANIPNYLYGDSLRLQQVLLNLAGNSVKFTETGEIVISIKLIKKNTEQVQIDFSVQDSGIGIAENKIAYIFEGFTQAELSTSRRYGGTGLGLAISQHLVQLMGSQLNVNSTFGKGSCFYFSLTFNYKNPESALSQYENNSALSLLIIDNSVSSKRILKNITDTLNCEAAILNSLTEALPLLRNTTQLYDILLLDWRSINIYDLEAIEELYDFVIKHNVLLIIMLTVEFKELSIKHNNKLNELARGFLIKPITPTSFAKTIYEVSSDSIKPENLYPKTNQRLLGLSLLLVEDNLANQQVAFEILNLEGASVSIANNGLEAINLIHNESKKFDVILTDIQMPEMDGYETSRQLRLEFSRDQLPIIAMTANAMPADREKCFAAGMNAYITKPIVINQMVDVILNCLIQHNDAYQENLFLNQKNKNLKNCEDIDLSSALERLNNNELIYARLASSFCLDYNSIGLQINQLWQARDIKQLSILLHTLKGLSATLGANHLAELAANAENAIKEKINDEQGKQLFNELNSSTKKTISQLKKISSSIMENKKSENFQNNLNKQQIIELIHWLDYLLSEYNMEALEAFSSLKQQTPLNNKLSDLEETMRQLNFSDARTHLNKLINFVNLQYSDTSD